LPIFWSFPRLHDQEPWNTEPALLQISESHYSLWQQQLYSHRTLYRIRQTTCNRDPNLIDPRICIIQDITGGRGRLCLKTRATLHFIAYSSDKNYFVFSTSTVAIGSSA
jgi:hypothetical protein